MRGSVQRSLRNLTSRFDRESEGNLITSYLAADRACDWASTATCRRCIESLPNEGSLSRFNVPERLHQAITPAAAQHLSKDGYAVLDNVFGRDVCSELRNEIKV